MSGIHRCRCKNMSEALSSVSIVLSTSSPTEHHCHSTQMRIRCSLCSACCTGTDCATSTTCLVEHLVGLKDLNAAGTGGRSQCGC